MKKSLLLFPLLALSLVSCTTTGFFNSSDTESTTESIEPEVETAVYNIPSAPTYEDISEDVINNIYRTFYIDSLFGNDSNTGLDPITPKKTLSSVETIISTYADFSPIRIFLKRGSHFYGNLILTGYTSSEEYPFILDAYGEGDMPVIHGDGDDSTVTTNAILWIREENTRVYNIEITGPACTRGIYVLPRKSGVYKNIVIKGCYVHDVNWNWEYPLSPNETHPKDINPENVTPTNRVLRYRRLYGGIEFFNGTIDVEASIKAGPITYDHVFVENNRIENVSHIGINFYNYWVNRGGIGYGYNKYVPENPDYQNFETGVGYFPYTNVVVKDNFTLCTGGDGIVVDGTDGAWIVGNTSYKSSYLGKGGYFNAGIWVHNVRGGYMLYNEAAYTYLQHGAGDGEGFDIDIACEDIHFYYNYAHHNEGGGLLLCNNTSSLFTYNIDGTLANTSKQSLLGIWKNNYCRNNVFAFNGIETNSHRSAFITLARQCDDFVAENNTVLVRGDIEKQHIINCEDSKVSRNHIYRNNIFHSYAEEAKPIFANYTILDPVFEGNLYHNIQDGNEIQSELVLSDDAYAVLDAQLDFTLPNDYDGYDVSKTFVPSTSLLEYARKLPVQLQYDYLGVDTGLLPYLGAFYK